jgi:hypothetical protein
VSDSEFSVLSSTGPLILSVGRLVEKKGFPDLIAACARLKQAGRQFRCAIYGEGPLHGQLSALIERLDLADCVTLAGERGQAELIPIFQRADIFALAPFVTDGGDRDGIPNVLVEAMACGLPVVGAASGEIPRVLDGVLQLGQSRRGEQQLQLPAAGNAVLRERDRELPIAEHRKQRVQDAPGPLGPGRPVMVVCQKADSHPGPHSGPVKWPSRAAVPPSSRRI